MDHSQAAAPLAARAAICLATLLVVACGGQPPVTVSEVAPPTIEIADPATAPTPTSSRTDQRVIAALQARLWTTIEVARLRQVAGGRALVEVAFWGGTLQLAGVDPAVDFERAFLAARGAARDEPFAVLVEHRLDEERVARLMDGMVQLGLEGSGPRDDLGVPAVRVRWRTAAAIVFMALTPKLLVISSDAMAQPLVALGDAASLPALDDDLLVDATALEPAQSLVGRRMPPMPAEIRVAHGRLTRVDGGVGMSLVGECADAEQAAAAAARMNELVERLVESRVPRFLSRLLPIPTLRASGTRVEGGSELSATELEAFMKLVRLLSRRDPNGSRRLEESAEGP